MFFATQHKKIVLASPHGALAHAVRCFSIGSHLFEKGFRIFVIGVKDSALLNWAQSNYAEVVAETFPISTVGGGCAGIFRSRLDFYSNENPFDEFAELERILNNIQPDVVLSDAHPLMALVCEKLKISHVSLASASWTKYYTHNRAPSNWDWMGQLLGTPFKQVIRRLATLYFNKKLVGWADPLNQVAAVYGLKKRSTVLEYVEGNDMTLITDIPEFGPLKNPLENVKYCGPIYWHPPFNSHDLIKLLNNEKKAIYVSLGSNRDFSLLANIASWLLASDYQVVMTLPKVSLLPHDLVENSNLITAELINVLDILPLCEAAIFHGGIGTLYQVLACGKPSVILPFHIEHFWNGNRLEQMGLGYVLHRRLISKDRFISVLTKAINNRQMRRSIEKISSKITNTSGAKRAAELIRDEITDPRPHGL